MIGLCSIISLISTGLILYIIVKITANLYEVSHIECAEVCIFTALEGRHSYSVNIGSYTLISSNTIQKEKWVERCVGINMGTCDEH